jgi:hypothetical protein
MDVNAICSNWKVKTPRDKKFLKWLLTRPCEIHKRSGRCSGQMIYHHTETGGMSLKGSDYSAISVCFEGHKLFDNASKKGVGILTEEELSSIIKKNKQDYSEVGGVIK